MSNLTNPIPREVVVNLNDLSQLQCACGGITFSHVSQFRVVPTIYSNTGKPSLFQVKCLKCLNCNVIYSLDLVMQSIDKANEGQIITSNG
jgi:hypothetical protein